MNNTSAERREELRRLASQATPGPWRACHGYIHETGPERYLEGPSMSGDYDHQGLFDDAADAAYVGAMNPATTVELLDYIDLLEQRLSDTQARLRLVREVAVEAITGTPIGGTN